MDEANKFQYRKRYEITCDSTEKRGRREEFASFNTASGMRSHVTHHPKKYQYTSYRFQYRKRYEITCDTVTCLSQASISIWFQYRKRYEITCDG